MMKCSKDHKYKIIKHNSDFVTETLNADPYNTVQYFNYHAHIMVPQREICGTMVEI